MKRHAIHRPFQFSLTQLLLVIVGVSVLLAIVVPLYHESKRNFNKHQCSDNLRWITIALQTYHDTWKCFPPVMWTDATGKPMHSWRVLIWPQLASAPYYDQYDFQEPWDGPNNRKLHGVFAFYFHCPGDTKTPLEMTNYVAIHGPGTAWQKNRGTSLAKLTDGPSNTILVVEIRNSDIHNMEPRDIDIRDLKLGVNVQEGPSIGSYHIGGALVGMADGSAKWIDEEETAERIKALITIAGNEGLEEKEGTGTVTH